MEVQHAQICRCPVLSFYRNEGLTHLDARFDNLLSKYELDDDEGQHKSSPFNKSLINTDDYRLEHKMNFLMKTKL